jgi:membrane protease YdiL (CAAX protease family)
MVMTTPSRVPFQGGKFFRPLLFIGLLTVSKCVVRGFAWILPYDAGLRTVVMESVSLLIIPTLYAFISGREFARIFRLESIKLKMIIFIIICSVFFAVPLYAVSIIISFIQGQPRDQFIHILIAENPVVTFLAVVIVAPVTEEIIYRGILLDALEALDEGKRSYLSVVLSGVIFGVSHLDLTQFPTACLSGILFSVLVLRFRSLYAGMLSHAVLNGLSLLAAAANN